MSKSAIQRRALIKAGVASVALSSANAKASMVKSELPKVHALDNGSACYVVDGWVVTQSDLLKMEAQDAL